MSFEVYTFSKTCQERLEEFRDILCSQRSTLKASCVFNEWKLYLQLVMEPCGWQAIWKISSAGCKELMVNFPALVLVMVENIDFSSLCATVKVIAVQDEFQLPTVNEVPLQQLFPTQDQREEFLDLKLTACALNQLRFFVANVWRPWDLEDDIYDWVGEHLESRLQLHEDICKGVVLPKTGKRIRALVREGRELQLKIDNLSDEHTVLDVLEDSAFGDVSLLEMNDFETWNKEQAAAHLEAHKQMIISELAMLENPIQRSLIESRQSNKTEQQRKQTNSAPPEACFVWLRGPVKQFVDSLERARTHIADDVVLKCVESAQDGLDESAPGDTVLLCAGKHNVASAGCLAAGGILRGDSRSDTAVFGAPGSLAMLDLAPRTCKVSLLSLTLQVGGIQLGILIQGGTLVLEDCDLIGDSRNDTQRGIVVMPGALLVARNCKFTGLGTAVDVHSGGRLEMHDCTVSKSAVGIQVEKGSCISLSQTEISSCTVAGVKLIQQTVESLESSGNNNSLEVLNGFSGFKTETVSFKENAKDVLVATKESQINGLYDD